MTNARLVCKSNKIEATEKEMQQTFTEWDRRYREDPEKFTNEASRLLNETADDYGEACTPYFIEILNEVKQGKI